MGHATRDESQHDDAGPGEGTTFKREGPAPADSDSGSTVEEMNQAAEDSVLANVGPDDAVD